ncbi:DUF6039 family protein [Streptomyces specialis]|uniref:DUF6039 family protein n=1 Tax=Streptomyces specialis TaxID=498367 RepID=UPI00073E6F04|nr:DUF6039 family protein [Streptomyces specialis]
MTAHTDSGTAPATRAPQPPHHQTSVPAEKLITSADAGFLIHRVGQLRAEFGAEGREFSADLVELMNTAQVGHVTILAFEEVFGTADRLHWLLTLKQPNDYGRLLEMVDHSQRWQEVSQGDRLPTKGGGNWERMFVEGSMSETIICPQHGVGHHDGADLDTFQPPARFQSRLEPARLLHSVNAPFTVHRRVRVPYRLREEARGFWYAWAARVTEALPGRASAFLYEEMWGRQDRLHLLVHLAGPEVWREILDLPAHDPVIGELLARPVAGGPDGDAEPWHRALLDGTLTDTLWAPLHGRH